MKSIFVLLFLILLSVPCFSKELYQYGVTAEIFENNTVNYKLTLIFVNNTDQTFIFPLTSSSNIKVESVADCSVQSGMLETSILCNLKASNRTVVVISYDSDKKISKKDSYFLFEDSFKINSDADTASFLIKLPEGTGLKEPIENSYSPAGALIGSDGRRTIINWIENDLKKGETFDVSIAYEKIGEVVVSEIPAQLIFIIIILIVAGSIIFYQFYWKNKNVEIILPILKKDEKKIFDTIMKHGSGVNQKIIVNESGYSKAKVSKVLKSLVERGILKLERIGRKNKVHIEKNFEKR
jgi:predicted transcriptional regulator